MRGLQRGRCMCVIMTQACDLGLWARPCNMELPRFTAISIQVGAAHHACKGLSEGEDGAEQISQWCAPRSLQWKWKKTNRPKTQGNYFFDFAAKTPNEEARFNLQKITWGARVTWFDLCAATNTLVSVCVCWNGNEILIDDCLKPGGVARRVSCFPVVIPKSVTCNIIMIKHDINIQKHVDLTPVVGFFMYWCISKHKNVMERFLIFLAVI